MNLEELSAQELLSLAKVLTEKNEGHEKTAAESADKISALEGTVATQDETIEKLNGVIASAKPAAQTAIELKKKTEATTIPTEELEFKGKKYQWLRAAFRLPGDTKKYTAQEAATDLEKGGIIERLLSIKGQEILKEVE